VGEMLSEPSIALKELVLGVLVLLESPLDFEGETLLDLLYFEGLVNVRAG